MLVALSDLHFQDVDLSGEARSGHNIRAQRYRGFFQEVRERAEACAAREIVILLNGDIFDFLRTERWFDGEARPYDDLELSPEAGAKVVEILRHTELVNREALDVFRAVARNDSESLGFRFPATPRFEFIPGNHDRYLILVPEAAALVRDWLRLDRAWSFRRVWPQYRLMARHGHEFDWINAEYNFEFLRRDAERLEDRLHYQACIGDWLAIDIATRIPYEFRRMFGGAEEIYRAIVEVDDVRPMTSVFTWLQSVAGEGTEAWKMVRRAIEETLRAAFRSEFVRRWIRSHDRAGFLDRVDLFKFVLRPIALNSGFVPDAMVQGCMNLLRGKEDRTTEERILTDREFLSSGMSVLCHGHYHDAGISFLGKDRVAVCTGSWRARFSLCHDRSSFFKGRCEAYAVFYTAEELRRRGGSLPSGFEFIERYSNISC
jgi:UDP-2,3-diacylglucosamine pyrophosphatase LpxH